MAMPSCVAAPPRSVLYSSACVACTGRITTEKIRWRFSSEKATAKSEWQQYENSISTHQTNAKKKNNTEIFMRVNSSFFPHFDILLILPRIKYVCMCVGCFVILQYLLLCVLWMVR